MILYGSFNFPYESFSKYNNSKYQRSCPSSSSSDTGSFGSSCRGSIISSSTKGSIFFSLCDFHPFFPNNRDIVVFILGSSNHPVIQ